MELMDLGTKVTLLWRLVEATESGKLSWDAGGQSRSATPKSSHFYTRVGRFGYVIKSVDQDDFAPYEFSVFRFQQEGEAQPDKIDVWLTDPSGSPLNDALQSLYSTVKLGALGLDSTVSDMFEDLSALDGGSSAPDAPVNPL